MSEVEKLKEEWHKTKQRLVRLYTCSVCGREGQWSNEWRWYGSYIDLENSGLAHYACSKQCEKTLDEWLKTKENNDETS